MGMFVGIRGAFIRLEKEGQTGENGPQRVRAHRFLNRASLRS